MTLPSGSRLGAYEIVSSIGAGGMGEVYKAHDPRLDRAVAIKVLPEKLAADADALARFEREAKAVAALSHPNILGIYELGRDSGVAYAAMELLTGETMRQRLAEGPIPQRRALEYGLQIAQGLAAAHEKGIVHRDLKPENLFITSEGRVKILDFGLASRRPLDAAETDQTAAHSMAKDSLTALPTEASPLTEPGMVLGTAGYMSPEQVRGRPADARSDIFSLGCVMYEMLTGDRAFRRDSAVETMAAIVQTDPPELSMPTGRLSPVVDRILRHCLEKRPEHRFDTAHDLAFALETAAGGTVTSGVAAAVAPAPEVRRRAPLLPLAGLALAAVALAAFFAGRRWQGPAASAAAGRALRPVSFFPVTDAPGVESSPALSPDGKNVVYVRDLSDRKALYLLRVGGRNPVALTPDSTADDWQPAFSPDGERIAFRSERDGGGIFVMGSTGESVKRVTDSGYNPSWSPDGREIALSDSSFYYPTDRGGQSLGLFAVEAATGRRRDILKGADGMQPSWSPHGDRIAYWGLRGSSGQRDLWTVAADGSQANAGAVEVTNDTALDWSPTWSPDGKFLYFSSNRGGTMNIWRARIEEKTGRVLAEPEPVTTPSLWSGELSFSRDGKRVAYASLDWRSTLLKIAFDPESEKTVGSPQRVLKTPQPIRDHQVSPDGEWVAFGQTGGQEDIFVSRMDGKESRRLTDDGFRDRGPAWSPDGKTLAFYSDRSGTYQVWEIRPDGSGLERLTSFRGSANFPIWSPDGTAIVSEEIGGAWHWIDGRPGASPRSDRIMPDMEGPEKFWPLSWSRDGSLIAGIAVHPNGGVLDVVTYSIATKSFEKFDAGVSRTWRSPVFLADGRRLLVRDSHGVSILDIAAKRFRPLFSVGGYAVGGSVGITRDNRWITYTETGTEGDVWVADLK
ncbi:MAG: protein kinase [Acidobacteriota bacterium]